MNSQPIRVLIADDHRLFRLGLRQACESAPDVQVVGEAGNGAEAIELCRRLKPDVILMDIHMPGIDGVQAARQISQEALDVGIIIVTVFHDDEHVFEAIKAGARGYLFKDVDEQTILGAVRAVSRGEALIDSHIAALVLGEFRRLNQAQQGLSSSEQLTEGEMDVLRLVAQGEDNPAIANKLSLSEKTVVNRLSTIYQKLHVNNRTQAALHALRQGWAPLHPGPEPGDESPVKNG